MKNIMNHGMTIPFRQVNIAGLPPIRLHVSAVCARVTLRTVVFPKHSTRVFCSSDNQNKPPPPAGTGAGTMSLRQYLTK